MPKSSSGWEVLGYLSDAKNLSRPVRSANKERFSSQVIKKGTRSEQRTWDREPAQEAQGPRAANREGLYGQEQKARHAEKMQALQRMAGRLAHDFNNLLMSVQGYVSLMLFDLDSSHPHYENLKKIESQVKKAVGLTSQLQVLSQKEKLAVQPTNPGMIAEKSLNKFLEGKKDLQIECRNPADLWLVAAEPAKIEQVLLSLYTNGWEAMSGNGLLSLEAANINLGQEESRSLLLPSGKYVRISITDHGVGIEEDLQQRIFEPFVTTKERGKATGLNLAAAYSIIRNHEGSIQFRSVKGQGTTFDIYLPAWAGNHSSPLEIVLENKSPAEISPGKETVLLVDDEDTIIDVIGMALKMIGYTVLVAKKGEEAIEIYRQHKEGIALVILDMLLPGMDGGKAFDLLKAINPQVKVLLSSGFSYNEEAAQIIARGCSGFIQKPFGIKELSQKIRELLEPPTC